MSRVFTLVAYVLGEFSSTWQVVIPPALALTFYGIAFQYGATPAYFATVTALAMVLIMAITVLLLSGRLNRAASYPLVARLGSRTELLVALVLAAFLVTVVLTLLVCVLALIQRIVTLSADQWLRLGVTWPLLYLCAGSFALLLTNLTSRRGSHILFYALVALFAAVYDYSDELARANAGWIVQVWQRVLAPFGDALDPLVSANLLRADLLIVGYALVCFLLAGWLFGGKDLLWSD